MKIRISFLAFGFVALLGFLVASFQHISASAATDRPLASPALGPGVFGTGRTPIGGAIPAPGIIVTYTTYLPMVVKPGAQGIYGYLTQGGVPIGGISLVLGFYDGSGFSAAATTTTNSAGYYLFTGIPALGAGQFYYVEYGNLESDDSHLKYWFSRDVTSYAAGSSISLGTSDLENIALVLPTDGVTVSLPYTFQWTTRTASPSDTYTWELYDPVGSAYDSAGPLGYLGNHTLNGLLPGFTPSTPYVWDITFKDSYLATGRSYYAWTVTFSNSGSDVHRSVNKPPQSLERRTRPLLSTHPVK